MKRIAFLALLLSSLAALAHANGVSVISTKTHIQGGWTENDTFYPVDAGDPDHPEIVPIDYNNSDTFDVTGNSLTIPLSYSANSTPFGAAGGGAEASPFSTSVGADALTSSSGFYYDDGTSITFNFAEFGISSEATTLFHPDGTKMKVNLHVDGEGTYVGGGTEVTLIDLTNPASMLDQQVGFADGGYNVVTNFNTDFFFDVYPGDTYQLDIFSGVGATDDDFVDGNVLVNISTMPEQSATLGLLALSMLGLIGIRRRTMACRQRV